MVSPDDQDIAAAPAEAIPAIRQTLERMQANIAEQLEVYQTGQATKELSRETVQELADNLHRLHEQYADQVHTLLLTAMEDEEYTGECREV